ncbi:host specificity protein [Escherichia coli]|nr:host specificity protein [Escherichia coli]
MTAELRNLPHIASMAFNEPLMLEPAYARVFFCALAGQLGISRLTDAVSGDSLTAQEALATLALSGDDDGPRQARSYQVMNGIAVLPVSGTLVSRTRALQPYSGMTDIRQVETTARYLGTGLYWIAASINIKPGHDYYFYIRSVNTVGKSAFVEAVGRASDDAEGYLDFFKGKITESHLGKELLEKVDLTEDNASKLEQFSKEWKDANDKWNAMWAVKIEQTKDGKHYVAGIGLSMEDTEEGKLSQFLVAANRIAFIDPANGNETPMFVAQGNQIFMNDVFLKRLTAPTITSGGNPPAFSLTPDGKLTAKNADISGSVNANSGTLNNVTINENCQIKGKLSANQIEGDIVKTVSKSFPRTNSYASGTITVRISDDQKFDRQVMIPPVLFRGGKHENFNSNNQQSYWYSTCRLRVTRNGQEIFNQSTTDAQGVFSSVIDMPAGQGTLTLTFTVSSSGANNWTPTTSISDLLVVVMKKSTAGISIS